MFWFKKKKHPLSLATALMLISEANEIIMRHKNDKSFMPEEADFVLLERAENNFHYGYCMTEYVVRCLHQRVNGEPEGKQWDRI